MTDAQTFSYQDHGDSSEHRFWPADRPATSRIQPRLRGWRIDPLEQERVLRELLKRRARRIEKVSMGFGDVPAYRVGERDLQNTKKENERAKALRKEFMTHAAKWKAQTGFLSSIHQKILHPSYQRIIGMGPEVLPFIFGELEKEPGHWFSALHAITGADPVPAEDEGRVKRMAEHWLKWAKANGIY